MKKIMGYVLASLVIAAAGAQAQGGADYGRGSETDPVASAQVTALQAAFSAVSSAFVVVQSNFGVVSGAVTAAQADITRIEGQIGTVDDVVVLSSSASTAITNGQEITVATGIVLLDGTLDGETNTITLAGSENVGQVAYLVNIGASNVVRIAQTGTWISPDLNIDPLSVAAIENVDTNQWAGK